MFQIKNSILILSHVFYLFYVLLFYSCSNKRDENLISKNTFIPKVVEAKGYVVPKDSMFEPVVIPIDESKLKKIQAGNPTVVPTNLNVHIAGKGNVIAIDESKLRKIIPGTDTFLLPKVLSAIDSPFIAGLPEVVITKDAYIKDQNPQNFSTFSKLQGLKHDRISCLLQDNNGNIWVGTYGGGVSKYDGKFFTHYTEKEGLSNNIVFTILQDKNGNLWFGTYGGVCKYDGKYFTHFTKKEGFLNNIVRSIFEDKSGNIWFGTDGGVSKYDGKIFTHFTEREGLLNNIVYSILQDKSGNLWFGTNGGVNKFNGKSFTCFTEKEGLSNNRVRSILEDKRGNLWFGTNGGVNKYNGNSVDDIINGTNLYQHNQQELKKSKNNLVKTITYFTENEGLSNNIVWSIYEDKSEESGGIWFGTDGGVNKYDGKYITHFTEKEGLSNNIVYSILQDKNGNLWFGTDGGVSKYAGKTLIHYTVKDGLSRNIVFSIIEDKSGNIWFGTDGGGVMKYDGKTFAHYTEKQGLSSNIVYSLLQDKCGNLWFGTYGGICKYDGKYFTHFTEKEGLSNNIVLSIFEDKNRNLWFGTYGGGVLKYDGNLVEEIEAKLKRGETVLGLDQEDLKKVNGKFVKSFTNFNEKDGLSNNIVWSILQDKNGNMWFGTDGGVNKYDGKSFTQFTEKEGLLNSKVRSILEDKRVYSGEIWLGTDGGLIKYDGKYFTHFTEKEGLSNNIVLSILQDKSGNMWFGTRFGINKFSKAKLFDFFGKCKSGKINESDIFFKNYGYEDGLLGIGINSGKTIYEAQDGNIWIGSNDRLTTLQPKGIIPDTIPPNMQLTSIDIFNEKIAWLNLENKKDTSILLKNGVIMSDFVFDEISKWYCLPVNLSLAYNNNYLTFNFIGITMYQPKKVKYQYQLVGIDGQWSAITNKTEATYGNLPHGTYTFKVKAMNSEGYWSKPFEYTFTIHPPWWHTWWARTGYGILALALLLILYRWRTAALRKRQKQLEVTVEERTAEVIHQKNTIEEKQKEITDSINYAKRIQYSLLAHDDLLKKNLSEYFVFFKPKDIVSGDFYWATKNHDSFYLAVCDSTGHGVPGAFMSLLNISFLNEAINEKNISEPNEVLNHVRGCLIQNMEGAKDGMDGTLIRFEKNKITYASAHNKPILIRNNQIIELNADKMPIGMGEKKNGFELWTIELQKNDVFYFYTDGFADQFGGPKGKKYKYKNLNEFLLNLSNEKLSTIHQKLEITFNNWKGDLEQVDDVCVIGIRI